MEPLLTFDMKFHIANFNNLALWFYRAFFSLYAHEVGLFLQITNNALFKLNHLL
jgi:hypothetical protein